jgi:hypothetical protein
MKFFLGAETEKCKDTEPPFIHKTCYIIYCKFSLFGKKYEVFRTYNISDAIECLRSYRELYKDAIKAKWF